MNQEKEPILFYSGNFQCKKLVETTLNEEGYHLMSSSKLNDLPELKALSYFHLILFCPGADISAEIQYLQEIKRFHPGESMPVIILDPAGEMESLEEFAFLDVQDYRSNAISKRAIRFAVDKQLERRRMCLEKDSELQRLRIEKNKKNALLEEVSLKAQESDRLKTAFLNNISHELRTPMNGILGFLEYLEDPQLEGELKERFIKNIRVSSERLLNTLQDLIEISEIEAGDLKVKFESVNIKNLIEFIYKLYLPRASSKGLHLSYHINLSDEHLKVWSDANKLKGVLIHLLNNALKFTSKGDIKIHVHVEKGQLCMKVEDSGIGMNKEDIDLIYQHFVQIEEHLTRKYDGLGLGLSICEAYSRCLNGDLKIESEVDKGTCVSLSIPFISAREVERDSKNITGQPIRFERAKVLLVDDDPINLQLLDKFLKDSVEDLQTVRAKNGVEAVEFYKQSPDFDLILMDLKMPLMNGFEATQIIRQMNQEVPIIAQTAYAMHQDKEKALQEGCNDYLSKPLNKTLFYQTLEKYLLKLKVS